jgi:signal transduction histidine kinase/ligand-binding sensor domain-containing protein
MDPHTNSSRRCWTALLSGAIALGQVSEAQTPGISGVNVVIRRISTDQGLSHANVWAITQDHRGFIWIGTDYGLNRFDGKDFTTYTSDPQQTSGLSSSGILSCLPDSDGILWIGTFGGGVNRFDPATLTFKRYAHEPANDSSLSNNSVRSICRDRAGVLWVGTSRGLNRFNERTGSWTRYLPTPIDSSKPGENIINAIVEDRQGSLWIGTGDFQVVGGGLFKFDRQSGMFSRYWQNPFHPEDPWVVSIMEDRLGTLWVASNWGGLDTLDKSSGRFIHIALPGEGPAIQFGPFLKSVAEDSTGAIWIATWGSGLFRYDRHTRTFTRYIFEASNPGSLSSPTIRTLFVDKAGLLWVGTAIGGVNTVATKPFLHQHTVGDSLRIGSSVELLHADRKGTLWLGALGLGLWRFDPRTQRSIQIVSLALVQCICEGREGDFWFSNNTQVMKYNASNGSARVVWSVPFQKGRGVSISSLYCDSEGFLWVGTFQSLFRVNRDVKKYSVFVHDPLDERSVSAGSVISIHEDRSGKIWVGTSGGLSRFEKETQSFTRFIHDERDSSSLSDNSWCTLFEDRSGNLWVGTQNGLNRLNNGSSSFTRYYPPEQGFRRSVGRMQEDRYGHFWYAMGEGIAMFSPSDGSFRAFDQSDGIERVDVQSLGSSCTTMADGEMLFGTANGILVFHPDQVGALRYVPPVVITGIRRSNKPVRLVTSSDLLREITFEHDENVFTVQYAALSYDMPEFNEYAYRLAGFDKDWIYCGNKQEATYTNLDPGRYTFYVKGSNHDGVWNEAGTSLAIVIRPAYWQTWWFRGLFFLALIGSIATVVGYVERTRANRKIERLEKGRAVEQERARISQDMHDEVGSSLSEIAILSELARKKPGEAETRMKEISERCAEVIDNVSEIVWAMNSRNDNLDSLVAYLRRYAVKYLNLAGIPCRFISPETVPPTPLPAEVRRNIFLVVKEALHNIVKHSGATEVSITVTSEDSRTEIAIQDNGRGFAPESLTAKGNGLDNMRKRVADIGGNFTLQSAPQTGTRISIGLPSVPPRGGSIQTILKRV